MIEPQRKPPDEVEESPEGEDEDDFIEDCPHCVPEWRKFQKTGIGAFRGIIRDGIKYRWWICPHCRKEYYVWE